MSVITGSVCGFLTRLFVNSESLERNKAESCLAETVENRKIRWENEVWNLYVSSAAGRRQECERASIHPPDVCFIHSFRRNIHLYLRSAFTNILLRCFFYSWVDLINRQLPSLCCGIPCFTVVTVTAQNVTHCCSDHFLLDQVKPISLTFVKCVRCLFWFVKHLTWPLYCLLCSPECLQYSRS